MLKRRMLALMLSVVCCGGAILAGCSQNQGAGTSDAVTSAGGKREMMSRKEPVRIQEEILPARINWPISFR